MIEKKGGDLDFIDKEQLAKNGSLSYSELCNVASNIEMAGRIDLSIKLYYAWLANTNISPETVYVWYNVGVLLLNSGEYVLSEQAFLNSHYYGFEGATKALQSVNFNELNKQSDLIRSVFSSARSGTLSIDLFIMVYERLYSKGPSQLIFEIFRIFLTYSKFANLHALWFEFGIISSRLNYTKAASTAFQTALDLQPNFKLAKIMLGGERDKDILSTEFVKTISLQYTNETYGIFRNLIKDISYKKWQLILKDWLKNIIGSEPYMSCYKLGMKFRVAGDVIAAKLAFSRCAELNPHFEKAYFLLGPEVNPVDDLDSLSLLQATEMRAGRIDKPKLPDKRSRDLSKTAELILKAPHLFRILIDSRTKMLEAFEQAAEIADGDDVAHEKNKEKINQAIITIANIRKKFASLYSGEIGTGRSAFLFSWFGVGDHIYLNGAVRYLSTIYDRVYVGTTHKPPEGIMDMYRDDPAIIWQHFIVDKSVSDYREQIQNLMTTMFGKDGFFAFGGLREEDGYKYHYPDAYYDELGIDPSFAATYFYVKDFPEGEELLRLAQAAADKIIFTHTRGSNRDCSYILEQLNREQPDALILNPEVNIYNPGHKYHETAQKFLWSSLNERGHYPIFWYIQTMSNAAELHLIDSSFWALAHYIPKITGQKIVCYNHSYDGTISDGRAFFEGKSLLFDATYVDIACVRSH